jgi:hypothetical protein
LEDEPTIEFMDPIVKYSEPIVETEQGSLNGASDGEIVKISDTPASPKELELAEELENMKNSVNNDDDLDDDTKKLISGAFEEDEDDKKLDNILN